MAEKKNYYDEKKVQELIRIYKEQTIFENGVCISRNVKSENELVKEVQKIVAAIIFTYGYQRFEPYEDLMQHGMMACIPNFLKFSAQYGTSYNFFSLIAKKSLLNYTIRRKRHRNGVEFEKIKNVVRNDGEYDFSNFIADIEDDMFFIIDQNFIGTKRKKHTKTASLIIEYLNKSQTFVSKSDLYCWCRSYGVKQNIVREFIKDFSRFVGELNIKERSGLISEGELEKDE